MKKWINKLSKKDLLQLHNDVICEDTLKEFEFDKSINKITDEAEVECTFMENWNSEDEPEYIPTNYTFKDYEYIDWETSGGDWDDQAKYRTWLAKHFGIPYIIDLLEAKTGIKRKDSIPILNNTKEKP